MHGALRLRLGAQQPNVSARYLCTRRADVFAHFHGIRVCCVNDNLCAAQKFCHLRRGHASGVHRDAIQLRHDLFSVFCRDTDLCRQTRLRQLPAQRLALTGAGKNHPSHLFSYPLGVTSLPFITRVWLLPINTVVNMSTLVSRSCASV